MEILPTSRALETLTIMRLFTKQACSTKKQAALHRLLCQPSLALINSAAGP